MHSENNCIEIQHMKKLDHDMNSPAKTKRHGESQGSLNDMGIT